MSPITIEDIATQLGLSKSTVSRALRDHPGIARATCRRVQEAARASGYVANPAMSAIAARRFQPQSTRATIAVLHSGLHSGWTTVSVRPAIEEARRLGFALEDDELKRASDLPAKVSGMYARGVAAILLTRWDQAVGALRDPNLWAPFACASLDPTAAPWGWPSFASAPFEALLMAFERALERGYQRIGFIVLLHEPTHPDDLLRRAAIEFCRVEHPGRVVRESCFLVAGREQATCVQAWWQRMRPDAVIGFHDPIRRFLLDVVPIPEACGFVSLSKSDGRNPAVTGCVEGFAQKAKLAVTTLDRMLRAGEYGLQKEAPIIRVPVRWWEGETLPAKVQAT